MNADLLGSVDLDRITPGVVLDDGLARQIFVEIRDLREIAKSRLTLAHTLAEAILPGVGHRVELRAASVDNPFDLKMFGNFKCPTKF